MNSYRDVSRGQFQNLNYAKQIVSFDGLRFMGRNGLCNVTPTDVDGLVQLDKENCFILFELKHSGDMSTGQESALTKLCDAIQAGGTNCIVFMAVHNTPYPEPIIAKDAVVKRVYWNGRWYIDRKNENRKLYEIALSFVDFIKR